MASQSAKNTHKKPKLVRDSFTIPKQEFAAIELLKTRAIALGTSVKKSELLRAGLMVLQGLGDADYKSALAAVPTLKTGRPAAEAATAPKAMPGKARAKPAAKPAAKAAAQPVAKPAGKSAAKPAARPARKPAARRPAKA